MKKVIAKEGIDLPSGEHIPYGAKIGVTAYGTHHDEDTYNNAYRFDTFRFSAPLEQGLTDDGKKSAKPLPMVQSTDNFMSFSRGRHAW